MAAEAERLLADTDWVPESLRTVEPPAVEPMTIDEVSTLPAFLADAAEVSATEPLAAE